MAFPHGNCAADTVNDGGSCKVIWSVANEYGLDGGETAFTCVRAGAAFAVEAAG